jgi:hypothetical protein
MDADYDVIKGEVLSVFTQRILVSVSDEGE